MKWFAAHIIMAVEFKEATQDHFPVWENIVLICSGSEREAFAKAEQLGQLEAGDDDGTFRWGQQPAKWVFKGVRKLTECSLLDDRFEHGTEITYNELELSSEAAIDQFVKGDRISVTYNDHFRLPKSPAPVERTKRLPKKRA